jgi:thiol-disulfide isomerase/thioredoxin
MKRLPMISALACGAAGLGLLAPPAASARQQKATAPDDAPKTRAFDSREALNEHYEKQFTQLDRQRLADLTALAGKLEGEEAEAAYSELFNLAVARDLYEGAEKAAESYLKEGKGNPQLRGLAAFVDIIAAADREDFDQAIQGLQSFVRGQSGQGNAQAQKLDANTTMTVSQAFLQRLTRAGKYDVARKVCSVLSQDRADPAVQQHFQSRLARLDMIGKPAPPVSGTDIDGEKVSLADLKGKVVLVDFWATWCPPCVAAVPRYNELVEKHGKHGFQVVGVNLDGVREGVTPESAQSTVRRFLVDFRVSWPSVFNGQGPNDFARAYGVTSIPATFLVDRDGKIAQVELSGPDLDRAVASAVGEKAKDSKAGE